MKPLIDFILCPFRFIRETWNDGPGGQWLAILFVGIMALIVFLFFEMVPFMLIDRTVKTGAIVDKWWEPQHMIWTGKVWIPIPERFHVIIQGKDFTGRKRNRDIIVIPDDFQRMNYGSIWTFN